MLEELRMSLGDKFPAVVRLYLSDTRNQLHIIERILLAQHDVSRIVLAAHSIRASSAHMGDARMVDAANALEVAAQDMGKGAAHQELLFLLGQIKSIFDETVKSLEVHGKAP
ncbi:MAG TPA: Hpt domain-containing protein [Alphaproteobacteria bacterium]|nr:Hpt domain-containing protein [Alphaproteobacteria bacterium]